MDKKSAIYVAGHEGLVGSAIVRLLKREGYENLLLASRQDLDLTDQGAVEDFFSRTRPEYVFLAAAKVGGIWANSTQPARFIGDNLLIQTHAIDAAWRHKVKRFLFLGSSCIYPRLCPQPMKEEHLLTGPLEPTNEWYAVAKIAGITMCRGYRKQYGFDAVCAMPTNLYGPNDNFDLATSHLPPALLRKFHLARLAQAGDRAGMARDEDVFGPIPEDLRSDLDVILRAGAGARPAVRLWGDGTPRREFLHVDDLAHACLFLMNAERCPEIVNVGAGKDMSVLDFAELARTVVGLACDIVFDPSRPGGTPRKLLDVSVMENLGWRPRIGLLQGLSETYQWYMGRSAGGPLPG
ncbi:MAG: GDP-L-fucose synthase [Thermodesulfobacteriota bacterium]